MGKKSKGSLDTNAYSGKQENIRKHNIKYPLKVVGNKYEDVNYTVTLVSEELVTLCPKTGLPDFGRVTIEYVPGKYLLEQKSFKLYLTAYRDISIFQEFAGAKIYEDFMKKVKPRNAHILLEWKVRGGVKTVVEFHYPSRSTGKP